MTKLKKLGVSLLAALMLLGIANAQKWQPLKNQPSVPVGALLLLTDGTVLLHEEQDSSPEKWYKLTPDNTGSYVNGTIKPIASLPSGYGPWFFGSVVLPDGRVVIEGGEYNNGSAVWTTLGALYDPLADKWTAVKPPTGWISIGDAQAVILKNGTYMQANCCNTQQAYFNAKTMGWTNIVGTGKVDRFDEEGWTLLPNGKVLTVDALSAPNSEIYDPQTKKWTSAGSTIVRLEDPGTQEIGPAVLRPDSTVFATGANSHGAGHTAIYNWKTGKWAKGPDFPKALNCSDAPAALEKNGKVIVMTSPGSGNTVGSVFFEWDGSKLTKIPGPPNGPTDASFYGRFLELPTGQLLFSDLSSDIEVFTPKGEPRPAWRPTVTSAPATISGGQSYVIKGTQFNGLSQGAAYGDDFQDATNYPLVRITNNATKHVVYARTHDHSTMAVETHTKPVSTNFDVPAGVETGASTLQVVANGISSTPVAVTVQ